MRYRMVKGRRTRMATLLPTADVAIPPIRQDPGSPHTGRPFAIRLRQLFFCEALPTIGPRGRMIESAAEGVGIAFARRFCELWANNPPSRAGIKADRYSERSSAQSSGRRAASVEPEGGGWRLQILFIKGIPPSNSRLAARKATRCSRHQ